MHNYSSSLKSETGTLGNWPMRKDAAKHMHQETIDKYISADLDASHLAELQCGKQSILDDIAASRIVPQFDSTIPSSDQPNMPAQPSTDRLKKKKTRHVPEVSHDFSDSGTSEQATVMSSAKTSTQETKSATAMTKRACSIFSRMFSGDMDASSGKECDWDQFVYAMKDVGVVARNSAGSAVNFQLGDRGAIVFHRPHPVAKTDPIMLKSMARKLNKWFGWDKNSFVVATTCS